MGKRKRLDPQSKEKAKSKLEQKEQKLKEDLKKDKELRLLKELEKKGTVDDKVSALIMKVEKSIREDVCDFEGVDQLLALARKKSRHQAQAAVDGLRELFAEKLLPNEELKYMNDLDSKGLDKRAMTKIAFQDKLKTKYFEFLQVLKNHTQDTVEFHKKAAIKVLADLCKKPEMRTLILELIINKLGDPQYSVPTTVVLEVNNLLKVRRNLMLQVIQTVKHFVFRKNISANSKFYSVVLLNSLRLRVTDQEALQLVIQTLLQLFPSLLSETHKQGSKTIALLLKALNKFFQLFPQKANFYEFFSEEFNQLYKLTHFKDNFNIQIQSLRFIMHLEQSQGSLSDRYYRTLYEHILPVPKVRHINYRDLTIFFNTLLVSMKGDHSISRLKAFLKRFLQVCLICEPGFILGGLLLVSELFKAHPEVKKMLEEKPAEDEEEVYEDMPDSDEEAPAPPAPQETSNLYDPIKREPKYSKAEYSCLYELRTLCDHFHPRVKEWAQQLMEGEILDYEGDPLSDFTTMSFLDQIGLQEPGGASLSSEARKKIRGQVQEEVNSDQTYLHKFLNLKGESEEEQESEEDESEEEFADWDDLDFPEKKQKTSVFEDAENYTVNNS